MKCGNDVKIFLENEEKNIYEIELIEEKDDSIILSISHFNFLLKEEQDYFILKTEEEFLLEICKKVNQKQFKSISSIFSLFNEYYSQEIEEKPLYEGQDVFELENDNNDMKFLDRIRFKEEDFNSDLFIYIFEFLHPFEICKFQRISKKFYEIGEKDILWKKFCYDKLQKKSWKLQYQYEISLLDFKWDIESSNLLSCTIEEINSTTIKVKYYGCDNQIFLKPKIKKGKASITIEATGTNDEYNFIGVTNENYDNNCLCNAPNNAFYIYDSMVYLNSGFQVGIHISFKHSNNSIMKIDLNVENQTVSFNGKEFSIFGKEFRFFVGKCNSDIVSYKILKVEK